MPRSSTASLRSLAALLALAAAARGGRAEAQTTLASDDGTMESLWSLTAPRGTIQSVRVGSCVLYPVTGLQAWLDRQAQATSEGGAA